MIAPDGLSEDHEHYIALDVNTAKEIEKAFLASKEYHAQKCTRNGSVQANF